MRRYRGRRNYLIAGAVALATLAGSPAPASSDTQPVSGVAVSLLGMVLSGSVLLTPLTPGSTSTGSGLATITSTGPWVLRVSDAATAHPGHLVRTSGTTGADFLASSLGWTTTPALGGTGASGTLTGTPAVAASGTFTNVVGLAYSQPIAADEQLATGATYGLTVTWTVSPT